MSHAMLLPLLLLAAPGCSPSAAVTPATEPAPAKAAGKYPALEPGTPGMVGGAEFGRVRHTSGRPWQKGEPEFADIYVEEGDRLIVLDEPDTGGDDRWTKVRMETGTKAGRSYLLERRYIRPLSTPPR